MVTICQCVPTGFRLVSYFCLCCLMFFAMFFASNLPKDRDSEVAVSCPTFGCACWSWLTARAARAWTFWIISAQQAITQCNNDSLALYTYRYMSCKICREDYWLFKLYSNIFKYYRSSFLASFSPVFVPSCARCITVWWHFTSNAPMNFWPRKLSLGTQSGRPWRPHASDMLGMFEIGDTCKMAFVLGNMMIFKLICGCPIFRQPLFRPTSTRSIQSAGTSKLPSANAGYYHHIYNI